MITMVRTKDDVDKPTILCDVCGKAITTTEDAAVAWSDPPKVALVFWHTECGGGYDDVKHGCDVNMGVFLLWLEQNTRFNRKDAETQARLLNYMDARLSDALTR
jgi:hypothetical protein